MHSISWVLIQPLLVNLHDFQGIIEAPSWRRGDSCQWAKWRSGGHRHASDEPGLGTSSMGELYSWSNPTQGFFGCLLSSGHAWKMSQTWNRNPDDLTYKLSKWKYTSTSNNSCCPNYMFLGARWLGLFCTMLADNCWLMSVTRFSVQVLACQSVMILMRYAHWYSLADFCCPFQWAGACMGDCFMLFSLIIVGWCLLPISA